MAGVKPSVQVELVGWRDNRGRFAALTDDAITRQRTVAKEALVKVADRARELSPLQDDEDHGKHKKYGGDPHFSDQWFTDVQNTSTGADGSVTNRSRYANLVLFRTKPHPITKGPPGYLSFQFKDGGQFHGHRVNHPGTGGHDEIVQKLDDEMAKSTQQSLQRAAVEVGVAFEGVFSRFSGRL